ncbi:hypothetical protein Emin_0698 [Elusimicrobium minutum Pei191]|uniref:Uncharacterized protein n=1 Tax=Elusimicrobium minutum (strain Pei191) TaxID=445932 RepID=B2KCK7_ELUMP|nr:hypothetical protein [Elusimicrobium minutum]ACC98253.1 hypothetical protein Emin_0698 [Elusimicrobium minutum Pei191]
MANIFKTPKKTRGPLIKDKRNIIGAIVILLLLLLLFTTVPVAKIPLVRNFFELIGFNDAVNNGYTLAGIVGRGTAKTLGFENAWYNDSALARSMSSLSPLDLDEFKQSRLLDAQRLRDEARRRGEEALAIKGVARDREGRITASDYNIDGSRFKSGQEGFDENNFDIPLYSDPLGDDPVSGFARPIGGSKFAQNPPYPADMVGFMGDKLGMANKGKLGQFVDPKGKYRRGRASIGDLGNFGDDPFGQSGTAWVFSRAGDRTKLSETKKALADAAFDGSMAPDDVILKEAEKGGVTEVSGESDPSTFLDNQKLINSCREARLHYNPFVKQARDNMNDIMKNLKNSNPTCKKKLKLSGWKCYSSNISGWVSKTSDLMSECNSYNGYQQAIASACKLSTKQGDCSKIVKAAELSKCGGAFIHLHGCKSPRGDVNAVTSAINNKGGLTELGFR